MGIDLAQLRLDGLGRAGRACADETPSTPSSRNTVYSVASMA